MRDCLAHEHGNRDIVEHIASIVDNAVLAVGRVWIQRDVRDNGKVGKLRFYRAHRSLNEAIRIGTLSTVKAFSVGIDNREERYSWYSERCDLLKFFEQDVHTLALNTGHRGHRFSAVFAIEHEYRVD